MQIAVGHANPDFDAYAASVAATKLFAGARAVFLGSNNANVRDFHNLHADLLDFVDLKTLDLGSVERLIMCDTRDPGRIGELGPVALNPSVEVVIYDHHPPMTGDLTRGDDRSMPVGASTSILVHAIRDRGIGLTPLEASVMLLGIHEDTGSLTYPGTTPYDADAVAFLMAAGGDLEVVDRFLVRTLTAEQRVLLEALTGTLRLWDVNGQQVAVGSAELSEYVDSASVVTHYLSEDLGHSVAVAVIRMPDRVQVVGRSRLGGVDIGAVMKHLGGGGHPQAASAALKCTTIEEALAEVRKALDAEVGPPLKAADIASSPVRTVTPATTMREAGQLMNRWGHGGLPVLDGTRVAGIVTRKDVDKAVRHGLEHAPVKGFMAREVISVGPSADLTALERLLTREGIGRLPVVEDGKLVGIVTRKDLLRAEHGDAYLDRGLTQVRGVASARFMEGFERLLPAEAREAIGVLGALAQEKGVRAHLVGGFVRDMLLGRPNLDIDVVVEGDGVMFAEAAAERLDVKVRVHRRFGTAVLVLGRDVHMDVTSARTEYYTRPGALPTVERSSLRQDLFRRDFTINAMAACIDPDCLGAIADPFGGLRDLERGVVRVLHSLSFVEDPTRVFRAARFEQRYGFRLDPSTEELARQAVALGMLDEVSGARVREELVAILDEEPALLALARLADLGALAALGPDGMDVGRALRELGAVEEALPETARILPRAPSHRVALLIPLVAQSTSGAVERWVRRVRLPRAYLDAMLAVVLHAPRVARSLADRRRMRDSRLRELLDPLPAEAIAYLFATGDEEARGRIRRYGLDLARVRLEVSGDDLRELGVAPGPEYSAILSRVLADRLDGKVAGRESELAELRRLAESGRAAHADGIRKP
ncbi:MAG TPA: CBS domain-containing protein [Coriobacteriia bacterium]|jgi:tRNA nucleotidyltransferase (CCA-adding enzyme)